MVLSNTDCFNPCFIGLASATCTRAALYNVYALFQSLFYWISLCDRLFLFVHFPLSLFQSLFYWISLCDKGGATSGEVRGYVSILVLLD